MLPEVESLRLLVLVGERGSLTSAAGELGMSQPAASKRISTLERRLGLSLVERSRRGSVLTASGELVAGWARRVLDELAALQDGVELLRRRTSAQLTVAASLTSPSTCCRSGWARCAGPIRAAGSVCRS